MAVLSFGAASCTFITTARTSARAIATPLCRAICRATEIVLQARLQDALRNGAVVVDGMRLPEHDAIYLTDLMTFLVAEAIPTHSWAVQRTGLGSLCGLACAITASQAQYRMSIQLSCSHRVLMSVT